jgi:hypothetical protein
LEILNFHADRFVLMARLMTRARTWVSGEHAEVRRDLLGDLQGLFPDIAEMCEEIELKVCALNCKELIRKCERQTLRSEDVDALIDNIQRELQSKLFFTLSHPAEKLYREPLVGWEDIISAFPQSQEDVEEMNKCYALARYTGRRFPFFAGS